MVERGKRRPPSVSTTGNVAHLPEAHGRSTAATNGLWIGVALTYVLVPLLRVSARYYHEPAGHWRARRPQKWPAGSTKLAVNGEQA
jgi:hypothetical protein